MTLPSMEIDLGQLEALEHRLGGCDFKGPSHKEFLTCAGSRDVQAAPGSGKTTLLVAKLVHLHERWNSPRAGICVLSHTNAARKEVEAKLGTVALSQVCAHPHFVGTVTTFVHRFLALPYLRGLGWPVRHIDNDRSSAAASKLVRRHPFLRKQFRKQQQFQNFAQHLVVDRSLSPEAGEPPARCPIQDLKNLPGTGTTTRDAFESVKGMLIRNGIYRYDDLTVIAHLALDACPDLAEYVRSRFPVVLLDEAQDTSGEHLALLDRLFGDHMVQRLGDCNQTLYESNGGWVPDDAAIDLGESRRFTAPIADFASKITSRHHQPIVGRTSSDLLLQPALIAYPKGQPETALEAFARVVQSDLYPSADAWAVAWVHRPTGASSSLCLQDYAPNYRPPSGPRRSSNSCFEMIKGACQVARAGGDLGGPVQSLYQAVHRVLRAQKVADLDGVHSDASLRRWLFSRHPKTASDLRKLFVEVLLDAPQSFGDAESWDANKAKLLEVLEPLFEGDALTDAAAAFLDLPDELDSPAQDVLGLQHQMVDIDGTPVRLNLGSIASVKGRTHDATLVVQSVTSKVKDVRTALELATGKRKRAELGPKLRQAVTNVFVGATRPRHLLCLALPEEDLTQQMKDGLTEWGWRLLVPAART